MAYLDKTGLERLWLQITAKLDNKVTKVDGKGLSTNDFTTAEKEQLATIISDYLKADDYAALEALINNRVEKVEGKDLSTNDFTNEEKAALAKIFGDYLTSADKEELGGAIDEAIANIAQADWDTSDPNEPSYIKNRTHFALVEGEVLETGSYELGVGEGKSIDNGAVVKCIAGMTYTFKSFDNSDNVAEVIDFAFVEPNVSFNIKDATGGKLKVTVATNGVVTIVNEEDGIRNLKYELIAGVGIKQLEEKFIPTFSIEDIDEILGGCIIPEAPVCYTLRIDETNSNPLTACEYMDDAVGMEKGSSDWDSKPIFKSIKPCTFVNGHVNYYLDPNNFNFKEDGSAAALDGTDGDVMIEFSKFAYRLYREGNYLYVSITNDPDLVASDNRFQYYAFSRNTVGDIDKMYIGAFKGWVGTDGKLHSVVNGENPITNFSLNDSVFMAEQNGEDYSIINYGQLVALQCLFLIKYGNLDSQAALGQGLTKASNLVPMGGTIDKGMYYGSTTDGTIQMKFAGIEDLWGNLAEWCKGFQTDSNTVNYMITYGNETITVPSGLPQTYNVGYVSKVSGNTESGFTAIEFEGDETTYYTDLVGLHPYCVLYFGSNWAQGIGLFSPSANAFANDVYSYVGARLTYL